MTLSTRLMAETSFALNNNSFKKVSGNFQILTIARKIMDLESCPRDFFCIVSGEYQ